MPPFLPSPCIPCQQTDPDAWSSRGLETDFFDPQRTHQGEVVDARWMEPPQPFIRTLEALQRLPDQAHLTVLLHREPYPLYEWLNTHGYGFQTRRLDPNEMRPADGTSAPGVGDTTCFEILIQRRAPLVLAPPERQED